MKKCLFIKRQSTSFVIFAFLFSNTFAASAKPYVKTRVVIKQGGDEISRTTVGNALTEILQEVNKIQEDIGNIENVRSYCTAEGFKALQDLVENTNLFTTVTEYQSHLLITHTKKYEVRGLNVRVEMGETSGEPIQELVFVLNSRLFVEDVNFALEKHHYNTLFEQGQGSDDLLYRQYIVDFIEEYRTAHNRKDIAFLEKVYSDDALIIVGHVLQTKEDGGDLLGGSALGEEKIKFIRQNKEQYISRLRSTFAINSFVRVIFDEIKINRHHKYPEIYGVTLKQRWNSSTYSDEGYLFVMLDFKDQQNPLIHVRSWQPEPFSDGSTVGLGDFDIIDSTKTSKE